MGFNISLFAAARSDLVAFLLLMGLSIKDVEDDANEMPLSGGIAGDRFILWQNMSQATDFARKKLIDVSLVVPFLKLDVSETAMVCGLSEYRDGAEQWSAHYIADKDKPIHVDDEMPDTLKSFVKAHPKHGSGNEFDILPDAFGDLTGFRYDVWEDDRAFRQVVEKAKRKRWWQLW
ncbi:hypothetical protein SLH49_06425 [Cognatiyoonia sp. IB215446]|uniref:hypothetical protein n=1 Tax=Cognatiyoonia sp. IB215446 TaxID=3097355 RepID=UPI002A0F43D7|nr:hypothetical protein [Cognatiyoonia sp. IB215446]MDX8347617.1 hypothetical protein [Cognatiyoonia sp. IB215446]